MFLLLLACRGGAQQRRVLETVFQTLTPQLSTKDLVRGRLMIGLAGAVKLKQLLVFLGYFF
jgi:hypothetical protein